MFSPKINIQLKASHVTRGPTRGPIQKNFSKKQGRIDNSGTQTISKDIYCTLLLNVLL